MSESASSSLAQLTWRMNSSSKLMDHVSLRSSSDGLELRESNRCVGRIDFARTIRIVTFKKDLITTDLICLAFIDETGQGVLVHEEMPGFTEIFDVLVQAFPGLNREWYALVMQPPFATNELTVWERPLIS